MNRFDKGISAYKSSQKQAGDKGRDAPPPEKLQPAALPQAGKSAAGLKAGIDRAKKGTDVQPVEGFVKSTRSEAGFRKAAKFLLLVGKEEAAKVLKHFSDEEIEGITREIADIRKIDHDEAAKILTDFGFIKRTGPILKGGPETVRSMLTEAFGKDRAEDYIRKTGALKGMLKPFAFLHDLDFAQIMLLLKNEPDTVISVILPHLEPALASKIMGALAGDTQKAVVKRIAGMGKIDSGVLSRMEETLKEKIRRQGKVVTNEIDGKKALADILKHMDFNEEDSILKSLAEESPDLSKAIQEKLFTMDIVFHIGDKDLQKVLRDYDEEGIATLIKGTTEQIKTRLLSNVSERRRLLIMDEYGQLGNVRKKDIQTAVKDFLTKLMDMAEEGTIVIKRERETYV